MIRWFPWRVAAMSDELVRFLLERFSDDEADARLALQGFQTGQWTVDGGSIHAGHPVDEVVDWVYNEAKAHIARHDPARVLAECASKRAIVEKCQNIIDRHFSDDFTADRLAEEVLESLAIPYSDHPGFDPGWRIQNGED